MRQQASRRTDFAPAARESARQSNATASGPPHRRHIGGWCVQATCNSRADFASAAREYEAIECDSKRAAIKCDSGPSAGSDGTGDGTRVQAPAAMS